MNPLAAIKDMISTNNAEKADLASLQELEQACIELPGLIPAARESARRLDGTPLLEGDRRDIQRVRELLESRIGGDYDPDRRLLVADQVRMLGAELGAVLSSSTLPLAARDDDLQHLRALRDAAVRLGELLWASTEALKRLAAIDDDHRIRFRVLVRLLTSAFQGATTGMEPIVITGELGFLASLLHTALEE